MASISHISSVKMKGVFLIIFLVGCLFIVKDGVNMHKGYKLHANPYYEQGLNAENQQAHNIKETTPQTRDTYSEEPLQKTDVSSANQIPNTAIGFDTQSVNAEMDSEKQQPEQRNRIDIKAHLLRACDQMKRNNLTEFRDTNDIHQTRWLISSQYKLMACKNFKVGSTNIARILYTLDHLSERSDSNRIGKGRARQSVHLENTNQLEKIVKSYTKFLFVRDPLERILSAYNDNRPGGLFKNRINRISFGDYLEWLTTVPDKKVNPHVVSFTRMCNPCRIHYDFIGSMDTFETDMKNILRSVEADKLVVLPERNQTGYGQNKTAEKLQKYLKDVPKYVIQKVYEKFYWDYFLFGFPKPDF